MKTVIFSTFENTRSYFHLGIPNNKYSLERRLEYAKPFWSKYLCKLNPKKYQYYFFIIANDQLPDWNKVIKLADMEKYLVKTRGDIYNLNYPNDRPRLNYFLFNFPDDVKFILPSDDVLKEHV